MVIGGGEGRKEREGKETLFGGWRNSFGVDEAEFEASLRASAERAMVAPELAANG